MTSRRKFLIQGGIMTTALVALKPFQGLANSAFSVFDLNSKSLVFLHTTNLNANKESQVLSMLGQIKNRNEGAILLKAFKNGSNKSTLKYDASFQNTEASTKQDEYHIIWKGSVKIGVIKAGRGDNNVIGNMNNIANTLKNSQRCDLVICLSQLGYKNLNHIDDKTLAAKSTAIDIIIGGHAKNITKRPMIALNSKFSEVIIDSSANRAEGFGVIRINFNEKGQKHLISFNGTTPKQINA